MLRADVWLVFFGGLPKCENMCCMGGKRNNSECDLNGDHLYPRVSGYERRSDIKDVNIMEFRVYLLL